MIRLRTFLLICLPLLMLGSCAYEQKVLVYEKIPQSPECMQFSDYLEVAACEQEQLKRQNVELQVYGKVPTVWKGSTTRVTAAPSKTGFPGLQGVTLA